jgi:hypothetical protein
MWRLGILSVLAAIAAGGALAYGVEWVDVMVQKVEIFSSDAEDDNVTPPAR